MGFIPSKSFLALMIAVGCVPTLGLAQQVISAHSGVVQYVEGDVTVGGEIINPKAGQFPSLKQNDVLKTEQGRAEILLTPGVFLRVGENSSVRMVSTDLTDTRVEFLAGSALVECDDMPKDNAVTMVHSGTNVLILKSGLYRFDDNPPRVGVYGGEVKLVAASGKVFNLRNGRQATLEGNIEESKFDAKLEQDALYRWSSRRSDYIAMANVSAAKTAYDTGSYAGGMNSWAYNPYFGGFTFMPYDGMFFSPFGYPFWSPFSVWNMYSMYPGYYGYYPVGYYGGGYGYGGGGYGGANRTPYSPKQLGYATGTRTSSLGTSGRTGGLSGGRYTGAHISGGALARGGFSRGGFSGGSRGGFSGARGGSLGGGHAAGGGVGGAHGH
jgi:hypothetical protein